MNIKDIQPITESIQWLLMKYGRHPEFFLAHAPAIEAFINQNHITAVEEAHLAMSLPVSAKAQNATTIPQPSGFPGGMTIAHLHFKGSIYLLTQPQWNSFCSQTIQTYRDKLSKVNSVSFENLMNFADAAERMM